ncbi:MAG: hypothetical protein K1X66_04755 [Verrucomicrobiae bacterium]|nr:hypothetical protein [Verrucomicrobiae bacterium]
METTEIPKTQLAPLDKQQFAIKAMATRTLAGQFWFIVWLITIGGLFAMHYMTIDKIKKQDRVIVLDSTGTFFVTPTMPFEKAEELHYTQALYATYALYMRNPYGFDMKDQLEKMFNKTSYQKALAEWKLDENAFQSKQTRQKVEISSFNTLKTPGDFIIINVKGQLIRTSSFQGRVVPELFDLDLTLTMMRNPGLAMNDKYPLVVVDYDAKITPTIAPPPVPE